MKVIVTVIVASLLAACGPVGQQRFAGKECKNVGSMFQDVWINPTTSMVCN